MNSSPAPRISCAEIAEADLGGVADLLTRGFRAYGRSRDFWVRALERLSKHSTPPGFPKFGYVLKGEGSPVGVILLIFSTIVVDGKTTIRCNVSSWYVEPDFRTYGAMLVSRALRHKQVTYIDVTPAPHTLAILDAQGYRRYCEGRLVAVPALSPPVRGARVTVVTAELPAGEDMPASDVELLLEHAGYGCISVICTAMGRRHPFVFAPRRRYGVVPFAHLVYCRNLEDFARFAGPLGRFLARRGVLPVILDANGPIEGVIGRYSDGHPKYYRGPDRPRLGDVAFSERAIFGV